MREFERRPFLPKRYDYYKYHDCGANCDYYGSNYNYNFDYDYYSANYDYDYYSDNYDNDYYIANYDNYCSADFDNYNFISSSLLFDGLFVEPIFQRVLV